MKTFHTVYNHENPVSPHGGVSMTDAQYKDECDINFILKSFAVGDTRAVRPTGITGDFSKVGDFSECLEIVNKAKDEFAALPSSLRDRFGNDPRAYVDFCLDPANVDECIRLGLREKVEAPSRTTNDILESIEKNLVTPNGENPA